MGCEVNVPDPRLEIPIRVEEDMKSEDTDEPPKPKFKLKGWETPLFHAARNGRLAVYDVLMRNGADDESKNAAGKTVQNIVAGLSKCTEGIREGITFLAAEKEHL